MNCGEFSIVCSVICRVDRNGWLFLIVGLVRLTNDCSLLSVGGCWKVCGVSFLVIWVMCLMGGLFSLME